MKKISQSNISDYLEFLNSTLDSHFDKKTIQKWESLSSTELPQYLQRLYSSLEINATRAAALENEFFNQYSFLPKENFATESTPSSVSESYEIHQPSPSDPVARKKNITVPILIALLLIVIAIASYPFIDDYFREKYQNNTPEYTSQESVSEPIEVSEVHSSPSYEHSDVQEDIVEGISDDMESSSYFDKNKAIENLANLILAEDNHNTEEALTYYSPSIEQYWDMQNPSREDLYLRYEKNFAKLAQSQNEVLSSEWVGPRTLEAHIRFSYIGANTGESKSVSSRIRYKFDDEGRIKYANKVN